MGRIQKLTREQTIQGLRELADILEKHPNIEAPDKIRTFLFDTEFRRTLGVIESEGVKHERVAADMWFEIHVTTPSGLAYNLYTDRPVVVRKEERSEVWPAAIQPENAVDPVATLAQNQSAVAEDAF